MNMRSLAPMVALASFAAVALHTTLGHADEGGVSFWLPGQYASFTATPQAPGLSLGVLYYHASAGADASSAFAQGGQVRLGLHANADFAVLNPSYAFAQQLLGGQGTLSLAGLFGHSSARVSATLSGPGGDTTSGETSDERWGFGDLYPTAALRWNTGIHNAMVYFAANVPIGAYDVDRLANVGIGHAAIDPGVGYSYFDPKNGHEISGLLGITFNFENPSTDYQNGVDLHLDVGASQVLSEHIQLGIAAYFYQQLTGDTGSGATLGDCRSRVVGIGPQATWLFPLGSLDGFLNARGYYEFAAQHRPSGWDLFVTFAVSLRAN